MAPDKLASDLKRIFQFVRNVFADRIEEAGWYDEEGLTREKVLSRGLISLDPDKPDWITMDIPRHRAVLGATYQKGSRMSAYQTYWMRFTLDVAAGELSRSESDRKTAITVHPHALVDETWDYSLQLEATGSGTYLARELLTSKNATVASLTDLQVFLTSLVSDDIDGWMELYKEEIPHADFRRVATHMKEALRRRAAMEAAAAWKEGVTADD